MADTSASVRPYFDFIWLMRSARPGPLWPGSAISAP